MVRQYNEVRKQAGSNSMARYLMLIGVLCIAAGLLWPWLKQIPLGRLPGDIIIKKDNFTFYFPLATSIILSIIFTIILYLMGKR